MESIVTLLQLLQILSTKSGNNGFLGLIMPGIGEYYLVISRFLITFAPRKFKKHP